ncbi:MAG: hypothetical protein KC731_39330 [Myxococcales bacterium]|nr:hypothetical protein [Myxococcales bacterium]
MRRSIVVPWLLVIALAAATARADDAVDDAEIRERLAFLEARIETQKLHAEIWWTSWLTFYSFGAVAQAVRATQATDAASRADLWISVVKATGGAIRFIAIPHGGILGLEPSPRYTFGRSPAWRLARAERIAAHNAARTTPCAPWYAHVANLAVNASGAVIVGAGYGDWQQGIISAAIGFAVGEASFFTGPWEAPGDWAEYQARWRLDLGLGQAGVRLDF